MSTKGDIGETALWIAAVGAALFIAAKWIPGLLAGSGSGGGTNVSGGGGGGYGGGFWGGSYGRGGMSQYVNGGYANGLPYLDPVSFGAALQTNGLSPDSAQSLAEMYNVQSYANPDGSPYNAAQQAGLTPQYDDPTAGLSIASVPFYALPDVDYVTQDAGGDQGDDSGGDVLSTAGGDDSSGDF
jgi:hypothetical protein